MCAPHSFLFCFHFAVFGFVLVGGRFFLLHGWASEWLPLNYAVRLDPVDSIHLGLFAILFVLTAVVDVEYTAYSNTWTFVSTKSTQSHWIYIRQSFSKCQIQMHVEMMIWVRRTKQVFFGVGFFFSRLSQSPCRVLASILYIQRLKWWKPIT